MIIEEVKPIQLRITIQPGDTAVFKYDKDCNPNHDDDDDDDDDDHDHDSSKDDPILHDNHDNDDNHDNHDNDDYVEQDSSRVDPIWPVSGPVICTRSPETASKLSS